MNQVDQDLIVKATIYAIIAIIVIFVIRYFLKKENFAHEPGHVELEHKHHHHHHHHHHHQHKHHKLIQDAEEHKKHHHHHHKEHFANEHHKHHEHHEHHKHHKHHSKDKSSEPEEMYAVGGQNNTIWKTELPCVAGQCQWTEIPGNLKYISNGEFDVWGTGPGAWAPIWRCEKPCTGNWQSVPGSLASVNVSKDMVYGVNDNGDVFQCPHTKEAPCTGQWTAIDGFLGQGGIVSV